MKKLSFALLLGLIGIQFIRPTRNRSGTSAGPNDITLLHPTSPEVKSILAKACYDCHSDQTRYPWYANVQPVAWWLADHVSEGKRHLNFSQFGTYPAKRANKKMQQVVDETKDHEMPLTSYTLLHREAKLSAAEITALTTWADSVRKELPPQ